MRTRDEVLREFRRPYQSHEDVGGPDADAMADRIRELEAQQAASEPVAWALFLTDHESLTHFTTNKDRAAVWGRKAVPLYAHPSADSLTVTDEMVNAAARRGRDYGFNAYCDNAQEYWAAMESVLTAALTRPTTPTRGSDE